jgi:glycosyltransferase involved in cell wall biosynthesis
MLPMGIDASAVVVADDPNLDVADELGFATVRRNNQTLGRKFNDGYQFACDPEFNERPVDFVVPCGSDDWIDPQIFQVLPENAIGVFERIAIVNETRTKLAKCRVTGMAAGVGIRIIPARSSPRPVTGRRRRTGAARSTRARSSASPARTDGGSRRR